jgi:hypothetical protein
MMEVFLDGQKLKGRLIFQYAPLGGERKWLITQPEDQTPYAEANDLDEIKAELKKKGQRYLVWAKPGERPRLMEIKAAKSQWSAQVPIIKVDDERRLVYGIVLEPDTVDAHGDYERPETIEQAAHNFLVKSRRIYLQHKDKAPAEVVESYIAPQDIVWSGQKVKQGSWVMVCRINDDRLWEDVKQGRYTGYSIRGLAEVHEPA